MGVFVPNVSDSFALIKLEYYISDHKVACHLLSDIVLSSVILIINYSQHGKRHDF